MQNPSCRDSDNLLYYKVCETINPSALSLPFNEVILNTKKYGFPIFESVRRARQKIQRENPNLASSKAVKEQKQKNEADYKAFAVE